MHTHTHGYVKAARLDRVISVFAAILTRRDQVNVVFDQVNVVFDQINVVFDTS